jgi:Tfp pilus assembly protein PilX
MTDTRRPIAGHRNERGSALLGVVLLLMLMSALAAALAVSGETETLISRNQQSGARAQAAAEAGLSHALELATTFIFEWKNNGFGSADAAIDSLLAGVDGDAAATGDNGGFNARTGIVAGEDIPINTNVAISGALNAQYSAFIMDDDATAPVGDPENGNLADDANRVLVVRATGFGSDNTTVTVEAMISAFPFPAVATNNDLAVSGSYQVIGSSGGIHTNQDLTGTGTSGTISQMATAVGTYNYPDPDITGHGGAAAIPIPPVNASDYLAKADFILKADGTMLIVATGVIDPSPSNFWTFDAVNSRWNLAGGSEVAGTYYSETDLAVSGNHGPVAMTLIAEGSIQIQGTSQMYPATPGVLFVTNEDLVVLGNPGATFNAGVMLAHEQIEIGGNASINAMILAEDAANVSTLITGNSIHGSVIITYNGDLNSDFFTVSGWRDVR